MTDERRLVFPFHVGGFDHELLARDGDVCLVQRGPEHFEVVILQHRPAEVLLGRAYPAREAYPGTSQWGEAGWSYAGSERSATLARERFEQLVRRQARTARQTPLRPSEGRQQKGG
jgi:hypothetical protein